MVRARDSTTIRERFSSSRGDYFAVDAFLRPAPAAQATSAWHGRAKMSDLAGTPAGIHLVIGARARAGILPTMTDLRRSN